MLKNPSDFSPLDQAMGSFHSLLPTLLKQLREGHTAVHFDGEDPKCDFLHKSGSFLFLKRIFLQQQQLKEKIEDLAKRPSSSFNPVLPEGLLQEQKAAVLQALNSPLTFLTGGPGTGKSFTIQALVKAWYSIRGQESMVALAAPTGKATQHLRPALENLPVKLVTLQRLLKERLLLEDLVIVDEASMIDLPMMLSLLRLLKKGAHLVLVGDPDQLPPVGFGQPFVDLINAYPQHVQKLSRSLRSDRAEILGFAAAVKNQTMPDLSQIQWYKVLNERVISELYKRYEPLLTASLEEAFHFQNRFRALSPTLEGPFGCRRLSQALFNRFSKSPSCFIPLIVMENDYTHGLYNGQLGVGEMVNGKLQLAHFDNRAFNASQLNCIEPAYCISVHKAQGSEFDDLLLFLPPGSESFGKELLYTAATRAKLSLSIASSENELRLCIERTSRRTTGF